MPAVRRAALTVLGVLLFTLGSAGPALAHGRSSDATNYHSRIQEAPDLPGVTWRVYGGDEFLGVTNTSDVEITVFGYGEPGQDPYLRIGPEGIFENRNSPATYQNRDRFADTPVPDFAIPGATPDWARIGDGPTYLWDDHRIHYMGRNLAPAVTDQAQEALVLEWTVPFSLAGGEMLQVAGDLRWIPGGSPLPWLLAALVLTLPALVGLRTQPTNEDRWPGLVRPAAAVLGVLAVLNLTNLVDDLFAVPTPIGTRLLAAAQTALFIAIAGFGAAKAWQAREGAFTALGVGAGALIIGQGILYFDLLRTSQTVSLFPGGITRTVVALSIAQALPLGIVAVIGTRRLLPPLEPEPSAGDALAGGT
jgi:hypothetical protein